MKIGIGNDHTAVEYKREIEKHPPIDEKAIRAMFMAMGRKPSEAQIRSVMKSMKQNNNL